MKKLLVLLWLVGHTLVSVGQARPTPPEPVVEWQATFFGSPSVALPLLVEAAVAHSAELEALTTEQAIAGHDVQIARKGILGGVLLVNSLGYGNTANTTIADQSLPPTGTTTAQTHYATGINLNLSLDRLASRSNLIARQQLQAKKVEQLRRAREAGIRRQVVELYQEVLLAHKVLALRQQSYNTALVSYQLAEQQFKDGTLLLSDISQFSDRSVSAAVDQETAVSRYTTAFMMLEDVVGNSIAELMTGNGPALPASAAARP